MQRSRVLRGLRYCRDRVQKPPQLLTVSQKMKQDALKMAAINTNQNVLPPVSDLLRFDESKKLMPWRAAFGATSLSPFSAASRNIDTNMPDVSASATPSDDKTPAR